MRFVRNVRRALPRISNRTDDRRRPPTTSPRPVTVALHAKIDVARDVLRVQVDAKTCAVVRHADVSDGRCDGPPGRIANGHENAPDHLSPRVTNVTQSKPIKC